MTNQELTCPCCNQLTKISQSFAHCNFCDHRWSVQVVQNRINYQEQQNRNYIQNNKNLKRLKDIEPLLLKNQKIIEIGCAEGSLGELIKNITSITYHGLEISKDALEAQKKIDVVFDSINKIEARNYNLLLSFHVLEHISNIEAELKSWINLLAQNQNSKVIIEVPHQSGNPFYEYDYNPEHLHQFSVESITLLLKKCGLQIESLSIGHFESECYSDSIRIIASIKKTASQKQQSFLTIFNNLFPNGCYIWGCGGNFKTYILPYIDQLNIKALFDSSTELIGKTYSHNSIMKFEKKLNNNLPFLITSPKYKEEITLQLKSLGVDNSLIFDLNDLFKKQD